MSHDDMQQNKPKRFWKIVLIVSIAINIATAGLIAGALWRFSNDNNTGIRPPSPSGSVYYRSLGRKYRNEIGIIVRDNIRKTQSISASEILNDYNKSINILRTKPFDIEAFSEVMEAQAHRSNNRLDISKTELIKYISEMNNSERETYADRLEKSLKRSRRFRTKNRHDPTIAE